MKTLLACLVFAGLGAIAALLIHEGRYGHYETAMGPLQRDDNRPAVEVIAQRREAWQGARPSIELPDGVAHDFGVMGPNEEGTHSFTIRNAGESELTLEVASTTCKCTVGTLDENALAPGDETEVELTWTVNTKANRFGQTAELRTNDPSYPVIRLEIKGQVVRQLETVPEVLTFGEVAAGEPISLDWKVFNHTDQEWTLGEPRLSSEELNDLTDFQVTAFQPSEEDGVHQDARQAVHVSLSLRPGLKQGPVSQNLILPYELATSSESATSSEQPAPAVDDSSPTVTAAVTGRLVGALSMLTTSKLEGVAGGGYLYDFGRIADEDDMTAKAFVVLKGAQRDSTNLSIGEVSPEGVVSAELQEPISRGKMKLYRLQLRLHPREEKVERLGMHREDFGLVVIESDNPKVPALKLRLKFSLPAR